MAKALKMSELKAIIEEEGLDIKVLPGMKKADVQKLIDEARAELATDPEETPEETPEEKKDEETTSEEISDEEEKEDEEDEEEEIERKEAATPEDVPECLGKYLWAGCRECRVCWKHKECKKVSPK